VLPACCSTAVAPGRTGSKGRRWPGPSRAGRTGDRRGQHSDDDPAGGEQRPSSGSRQGPQRYGGDKGRRELHQDHCPSFNPIGSMSPAPGDEEEPVVPAKTPTSPRFPTTPVTMSQPVSLGRRTSAARDRLPHPSDRERSSPATPNASVTLRAAPRRPPTPSHRPAIAGARPS
jgi:hypothetical protein